MAVPCMQISLGLWLESCIVLLACLCVIFVFLFAFLPVIAILFYMEIVLSMAGLYLLFFFNYYLLKFTVGDGEMSQ